MRRDDTRSEDGIQIRGLTHTYAGAEAPALRDIHLSIAGGSFFGLLGPNGAGKTTLISLLTGVLNVQQGEVKIQGFNLPRDGVAVRRLSGLVPQDYAFYPGLTGLENLEYFAGINGLRGTDARRRIRECADLCGLGDVLQRRARQFSGGLKRRLNLAIGLVNRPEILYLDEPTVGIDAQSRRLILDAIKALKTEGNTVIYTSHYMEEVQQLCDSVAIIDHGRVIVHQSMSELLRLDNGEGVLIELNRPLDESQLRHPALSRLRQQDQRLFGHATADELPALLNHLKSIGVVAERVHYGASPLEQVYLRLIQNEEAGP